MYLDIHTSTVYLDGTRHYKNVATRVKTGLGHPGHVLTGSSGSDQDSAIRLYSLIMARVNNSG